MAIKDECLGCTDELYKKNLLCNDCFDKLNYPEDYCFENIKDVPTVRQMFCKSCLKTSHISNLKMYYDCKYCNYRNGKVHCLQGMMEDIDIIWEVRRWLSRHDEDIAKFNDQDAASNGS